jgi:Flp pilus assembly pilin Flp
MINFILSFRRRVAAFIADERGATAIEYCMIGAMLSILILRGALIIGVNISADFLALTGGFH